MFAIIRPHFHHNCQTGSAVLCGLRKFSWNANAPLTANGPVDGADGGCHEADSSG